MAYPFYSNAAANPVRGLPADIGTEREILAKKRRIIDALLARGTARMSPTIDAGAYKIANWGDAIGSIADAYFGKKGSDELDERDRALGEETSRRTQEGITKYLADLLGSDNAPIGQDTRALDESGAEGAPPVAMGAVKANPIKAIAEAMGSGLQPLQDMAKTGLAALVKGKTEGALDNKTIFAHVAQIATPESAVLFAQTGDPRVLRFKRNIEKGADGNFADTTEAQSGVGPVSGVGYVGPKYGPVQPGSGSMPPTQTEIQSGKTTGISGGNVTPATKLESQIGEASVKKLESGSLEAKDAINGLQAVARAQTLIQGLDPVALGSFANLRLQANKVIQGLGGKPLPEGAKIEELNGAVGQLLLNKIRLLAPVTKEDIATMERIIGSTSNTKVALESMLDYAARVFARSIEGHNKFVEGVAGQPGGAGAQSFGTGGFTVSGAGGFGPGEGGQSDPLGLRK